MTDLAIRQATDRDLPELLLLYQDLIPGDAVTHLADATTRLRQLHRYPGSAIFVGESEGKLIATCTLIVVPNLTRGGAPYALIENVVTHRDYRKRGHGRRVIEQCIQAAWDAGCYKIMLLTARQEPAVHSFYQGVGFEQSKVGFQIRRPHAAS